MGGVTGWHAPTATSPLDAVVDVPASKSLMARALVLAALADEPTRVHRPLVARDSLLMADGLVSLGAQVDRPDDGPWTVAPGRRHAPTRVDCGLAGTVMRFLPPVAALGATAVTFDGDPRARERPLAPLLRALRDLGVLVTPTSATTLPVTVHGTGHVRGGEVSLDASSSSQFVSALLLAGGRFDEGVVVRTREKVPSLPHVDMTVAVLVERGLDAHALGPGTWRVRPGVPHGGDVHIEPDLSNAAVFLSAALVAGGRVQVPGWPARSVQPLDAVTDVLRRFGGEVSNDGDTLTLESDGRLHALGRVDLGEIGELTPTVAALALLADGPSTLTGVAHLRGHETDRLTALVAEIRRLGGRARQTDDGLHIEPALLHGGAVHSYSDHRMATFAALVGLRVPGVVVQDVTATAKTMPAFPRLWTEMVA
jgi:3-phosphoshikimate 1-carboxyvinyltransferase